MYASTDNGLQSATCMQNGDISYAESILGVATFDGNGLPREYFTSTEGTMAWVQTIFQALGLRSLLISSLQLEGFNHATIYGVTQCAIVIKQKNHYTAFLVNLKNQANSKDFVTAFIAWSRTFEVSSLKQDPRFHAS